MRFPLSAVDTYFGGSGSRVRVLYQLRRWPSQDSSFASVSIVAVQQSTICSGVRNPRSRAETADISHIPMSVGEVRSATSMHSASWELSGGSQWCSGPTRSSK